jgi:hypothetical protein
VDADIRFAIPKGRQGLIPLGREQQPFQIAAKTLG